MLLEKIWHKKQRFQAIFIKTICINWVNLKKYQPHCDKNDITGRKAIFKTLVRENLYSHRTPSTFARSITCVDKVWYLLSEGQSGVKCICVCNQRRCRVAFNPEHVATSTTSGRGAMFGGVSRLLLFSAAMLYF